MSFLFICPHVTAVFSFFFLPTPSAIFSLSLIQNLPWYFVILLQIRKPNVRMPSREDDIQCLLYFEIGHNVTCFHSQRSLTTQFVNGWLKKFPFLDLVIGFKQIYTIWLRHDKSYRGSSRNRCTWDYVCFSLTTSAQYPYVEHSWRQICFTRLRDWFMAWLQSDACVALLGNFNN